MRADEEVSALASAGATHKSRITALIESEAMDDGCNKQKELSGSLNQPVFNGVAGQLRVGFHPHFLQDACAIGAHGFNTQG